jgi:hypothetical protein
MIVGRIQSSISGQFFGIVYWYMSWCRGKAVQHLAESAVIGGTQEIVSLQGTLDLTMDQAHSGGSTRDGSGSLDGVGSLCTADADVIDLSNSPEQQQR